MKQYRITVIGLGYVGMPLAALLGQKHKVYALDKDVEKVRQINSGAFPIKDECTNVYLREHELDVIATIDPNEACADSDYIIVAVPTNFDTTQNYFDTGMVESVLEEITKINKTAVIVIRSTVPVGFTDGICEKLDNPNILFSPEFLRESKALYDNLYPSRIVVGVDRNNPEMMHNAQIVADIFADVAEDKTIKKQIVGIKEAEAIKLFSNTYLAMRVAFFNELDTYADSKNLNVSEIIDGVSSDPRIGHFYNNPSFGYGGYCLPKDTKQLLSNYEKIPGKLVRAVVEANSTRKDYIAERIIQMSDETVTIGIYRLIMKSEADNFRNSSVQGVIRRINEKSRASVIIYEPLLPDNSDFFGNKVVNDLDEFKNRSHIIVANRYSENLADVKTRMFTRDLFGRD